MYLRVEVYDMGLSIEWDKGNKLYIKLKPRWCTLRTHGYVLKKFAKIYTSKKKRKKRGFCFYLQGSPQTWFLAMSFITLFKRLIKKWKQIKYLGNYELFKSFKFKVVIKGTVSVISSQPPC